MCGIAGIVGRLNVSNRIALRQMNKALSHRGPDGDGYWESSPDDRAWGVMLAHSRLSILDLSPAAAQPMVDPVTGHVAVLNGEIYAYVELRARLSAEGQKFQSTGDTAVMLRAVSIYGCRAIRWLRGMFAFAVWNTEERKLILARDPLGIKPLYFARNSVLGADWSLIFASELRAILASELLGKPKLNPRATASMVWNGFIVSPETAVERIETVWPGQFYMFDSSGSEEHAEHYWSMPHNIQQSTNHTWQIRSNNPCACISQVTYRLGYFYPRAWIRPLWRMWRIKLPNRRFILLHWLLRSRNTTKRLWRDASLPRSVPNISC
jgi:asparagine synthase (glutamine-hydrolysing)